MKTLSGFTLIELLIVVAIIAILAAIAVPNFLEAQTRAKVSRTKSDMRSLATALETYHIDNRKYPPSYEQQNTTIEPRLRRLVKLTTPVSYMTSIPPDVFSRDVSNTFTDEEIRIFVYTDRTTYEEYVTDPYGSTENGQNIFRLLWSEQLPTGQWILRSRGPAGLAGGTIGGIGATLELTDAYDPTNGTVSAGNIMLLGPGYGFADR